MTGADALQRTSLSVLARMPEKFFSIPPPQHVTSWLLALLREELMEIVEYLVAPRDPLQVIRRRQSDAVDQRPNAGDFGAAKLAVPEVDVMNDLRNRAKRGVIERSAVEEHLERA